MTINLTGFTNINEQNLKGKTDAIHKPSYKIHNLKKYILTNYIIPLYSEQWTILNKNKLFIDETIKQLNLYYKLYKLEDINLFLELLKIIKLIIDKNELLTDLEDKNKKMYDKNNIINMVYKTTKIQILPEYEIYNLIIGKPTKKEPYNDNIINDIKSLITTENIPYDKISKYIINKYNVGI